MYSVILLEQILGKYAHPRPNLQNIFIAHPCECSRNILCDIQVGQKVLTEMLFWSNIQGDSFSSFVSKLTHLLGNEVWSFWYMLSNEVLLKSRIAVADSKSI